MGKVSNSLMVALEKILMGEIDYQDIDKIYDGTIYIPQGELPDKVKSSIISLCISITMGKMQNEWKDYTKEKANEVVDEMVKKAKDIIDDFLKDGKLTQISYIVPEGETVTLNGTISGSDIITIDEIERRIRAKWLREDAKFATAGTKLINVNGKYYYNDGCGLVLGGGSSMLKLFDSENDLIAESLEGGFAIDCPKINFFMTELFPKYPEIAEKVGDKYLRKGQILRMMEENHDSGPGNTDKYDGIDH